MKRLLTLVAFAIVYGWNSLAAASGWEPPNKTDFKAAYCEVIVDHDLQPMQIAVIEGANPSEVKTIAEAKHRLDTYLASRPNLDTDDLKAAADLAERDLHADSTCSKSAEVCLSKLPKHSATAKYEKCLEEEVACVKRDPSSHARLSRMHSCLKADWYF